MAHIFGLLKQKARHKMSIKYSGQIWLDFQPIKTISQLFKGLTSGNQTIFYILYRRIFDDAPD